MRVLGIDPGTAITGWGVVEQEFGEQDLILINYGAIHTPAKMPLPQRLKIIYNDLTELISQHEPDASAIEVLFFSKNVRTAMSVGHGRGVAMLALVNADLPIAEYKPVEIKLAIAGYGAADKQQMQRMVQMLLNLDDIPRPDDAADAIFY